MQTITLSSKNQIVIPSSVRAKLNIAGGDKLVIERINDSEVVLKKAPGFTDLIGTLPTRQRDPVKRIRDLRDDWR